MSTPLWRQMFDAWEQAVNPFLMQAAKSPEFREFARVGSQVNRAVFSEMERASAQWLHAWNLPAGSDVRRLRTQVRDLEKELRSVRRTLESLGEERTIRELNKLLDAEAASGGGASSPVSGAQARDELAASAANGSRSTDKAK